MKKIAFLIIVVILILGGYYYFQTGDSNPKEGFRNAQKNMENLSSYNVEVKNNIRLGNQDNLSFDGDFNIDDNERGKGDFEIERKNSSKNFFMAGSALFDDYFSFNLKKWPDNILSSSVDLNKDDYPEDWITIENPTEVDEAFEELEMSLDSKKLVELFKELRHINHDAWKNDLVIDSYEEESVLGDKVTRFFVKLDSEKEKKFAEKLYASLNLLGADLSKEEAQQIKDQLNSEMIDSELSFYATDNYILKSKFEIVVKNNESEELNEDTKWISEFYYDEFNEDLKIDSPEDYITIKDMVKKIKNNEENVAFKVNGAEFSDKELENMKKVIQKDIERKELEEISDQKLEKNAISKLAENYLLKRYARDQEWKVTEKDIEDRFEILKIDQLLSSRKELIDHLLESRFATSEQVHDYIYIEALKDRMAYEEYRDRFDLPEDRVKKAHYNVSKSAQKIEQMGEFPPLEESREQIEKLLLRHEAEERIDAKIKELIGDAEIEILTSEEQDNSDEE